MRLSKGGFQDRTRSGWKSQRLRWENRKKVKKKRQELALRASSRWL